MHNQPKTHEEGAAKQALTEADTTCQELLLEAVAAELPDVRLDAEEDTPTVGRFPAISERAVVIDPIDGTLYSYLEARGPYSIILGLAEDDRYVLAMLALPREGVFVRGVRGLGSWIARAGGPYRRVEPAAPGASPRAGEVVLLSNAIFDRVAPAVRERGLRPMPASGGALAVAPLLPGVCGGLRHSTSTALGVSVRGRVGVLAAREAGARVGGLPGEPFPDDLTTPAPLLRVAADEEKLALLAELAEAARVV